MGSEKNTGRFPNPELILIEAIRSRLGQVRVEVSVPADGADQFPLVVVRCLDAGKVNGPGVSALVGVDVYGDRRGTVWEISEAITGLLIPPFPVTSDGWVSYMRPEQLPIWEPVSAFSTRVYRTRSLYRVIVRKD